MKTWGAYFRSPQIAIFLQSCLCLLAMSSFVLLLPACLTAAGPQTQPAPVRIPVNVVNASLPVTIGVPIAEAANVFEQHQLGVADANGVAVPSQMRVLARWRGVANDASKPIKWMLVDFRPATNGTYFLTRAARPDTPPVTLNDAGKNIRAANSQLEIEIPKQGEGLIKSFKLGDKEMLRAPIAVQAGLPRRAIITRIGPSPDTVTVNDATLLKAGDTVRFEHVNTLKWDAAAGSKRLVTNDWNFAANRRYRLDEGTPQQEEIEVSSAQPQDLQTATALKFNHKAGARIRDLSVEQEVATIKSVNGQTIQFPAPLKVPHTVNETIYAPEAANQTATAVIERAVVEESNSLRAVVRQDGFFRSAAGKTPPTVAFALRYYVYANQPFVRVRLRMMNNGTFGFGAYRTFQPPFPQHALLRSLSVLLPTVAPGAGVSQVLNADETRIYFRQKQSGASLTAGLFEIAVPEFVENYPKALKGDGNGIRFEILPDTGSDHIFDGARAKTTDFYLGLQTIGARALTNAMNATLDPAYIASTGAVRPAFVEKRNWASAFGKDRQMGEAAARVERMFASGYAVEATDAAGAVSPTSIFEYRQRGENGEQFGWRNFGDLAWGDGYANVHYDLPFVLLREYLRTGDARAFQLGSEMARYRADWGHYRADDFIDRERTWNFRGMAFYEKGDHGTFKEPVPSHTWIEGLWLYWAMTGDEAVRSSALEGSEAFLRMNFTFANALVWNEPRWVGWPAHGLLAAWRYTGDSRYLDKARANVNLLVEAEESHGRKGYYISLGPGVIHATQPWAWYYSQLGVIEYWRETGDRRVADYLVRIADWLLSQENPPLKPGVTLNDGTYLPNGSSYFWVPDKIAEDRSVALAGLALPVLTAAARITNRDDLWQRAQQLFRDYAFYRDFQEGKSVAPASRHIINFRSLLYPASAPKVYGQMGLTVSEYLPELAGSVVLPGKAPPAATRASAPKAGPKPVSFDEIKSRKLVVGQSLDFTLAQADERGVPVRLQAFNLPFGAAFDPASGQFIFTPNSMHAGNVYQITFRAVNERTDKLARLDVAVVIDSAPVVTLLAPDARTRISAGKPVTISWSVSHSTPLVKYQVRLSTDGGASYPATLAELPGDASQYQWMIPKNFPATNRSQLRVMIKATDAQNRAGVDFSKQDLRIGK